MAEKNEMDETSHSIEWKIENFAFIDSESIRAVGHLTLTSLFEQERQSVLARLPEAYTKRFRTVGFYQDKPVLIVSPYDVPYGRIRRLWMEIFFQFVRWIDNEPKTFLENMPHLVHDFQCLQAGPECSVSLIPGTAIETFENGAACNLDSLPKGIQRKLMNKINPVPLTDAERVTVRGFENMIPFIDREVGRPPLLPWTCWTDPLNDCDMLHVVERLPVIVIPSETVDPRADRSFGTTVELWGPSDEARHLAKIIKYHGDFTLVEYSDGQRQWLPLQNQRVAFMTDNHVGQVVSCVKSADDSYEQNVTVKAESYVNVPNDKETSYSEGLDPVTAKRAETSALDAPKQICASLPETLLANSTRMRNESASPDAVVVCETTTSLLRHAAPASEKRSASPIPRESMLQKRYRTSGPPAQVMDADHPLLHVPRKERQKNNVFVEKSLSTPAEQAMKVPEPSEPLQVSQNRDVAVFLW